MASIYDIDRALIECINEETGEIDAERFEELQMQRDEKIGGTARWILDLKGDILKLKEEEKRLADKRHVLENRVESLKRYLGYALNGEKWKDEVVSVGYTKSTKVEIENEESFIEWASKGHKDYLRQKAPEIDKTAIKNAIKSGEEVEGAKLVETVSIKIK